MRLDLAARPNFAHHQTFHPRFGWLKKGYAGAVSDPGIFLADDATVRLGVGKNMVAAIRFWTTAFHVLERYPSEASSRVLYSRPTSLGTALLDEKHGYDPYFEDLATLWILHWHLVSSISEVPTWWSVFNNLTALEFSGEELTQFVIDEIADSNWKPPTRGSVQKDVDCLLHMYAHRPGGSRQGIDDMLDSPFRQLELIVPAPGDAGRFRFSRGTKPGLAPEVLLYICLDFLARSEPEVRTATLSNLSVAPGSPGRILKLTEEFLRSAVESVSERFDGVGLSSPGGVPQLAFSEEPQVLAANLLHAHYLRRSPKLPLFKEVSGTAARGTVTLEDKNPVASNSIEARSTTVEVRPTSRATKKPGDRRRVRAKL